MHFEKADLEGTHYNWIENTRRLFTGQPSRRTFDPLNGDQVLFLINAFGSSSEKFTLSEGKSIEQIIRHELPTETRSEISVLNWLKETVLLKK
jgi:hypothetical protein